MRPRWLSAREIPARGSQTANAAHREVEDGDTTRCAAADDEADTDTDTRDDTGLDTAEKN